MALSNKRLEAVSERRRSAKLRSEYRRMFMCGANVEEGGVDVKRGIPTKSVPLIHGG
jgi:hypothetical protein